MKIINPLYDKAFKYLMENEKYASKVLSIILDQEVVSVSLSQQETTYFDSQQTLSLFILDFNATIRQADGQLRTVLIELQKSKFPEDIQRFRNYLGSQYIDSNSELKPEDIKPMITIYILGYLVEGNPYLAVRSAQVLTDATTHQPVEIEDNFLKYLTHESYLIQVRRLPEKRRTLMERFFSLFDQAWVSEENYILDIDDIPEEFLDMARYLSGPLNDAAFRRQLELEEMVTRKVEQWENQVKEERKQKEEERRLKEEERRLKEEAKIQAEAERNQKEEERRLKEEERRLKEEAKIQAEAERNQKEGIVRSLAVKMSPEEIVELTTLSLDQIMEILNRNK